MTKADKGNTLVIFKNTYIQNVYNSILPENLTVWSKGQARKCQYTTKKEISKCNAVFTEKRKPNTYTKKPTNTKTLL